MKESLAPTTSAQVLVDDEMGQTGVGVYLSAASRYCEGDVANLLFSFFLLPYKFFKSVFQIPHANIG